MKRTTYMVNIKIIQRKQKPIGDARNSTKDVLPEFTQCTIVINDHSHTASGAKIEARKVVNSMPETIASGRATSSIELIAIATQQLGEEAKSQMQSVPTLSRSIRNWRQSALAIPAIPRSRFGYEIPDTLKNFQIVSFFFKLSSQFYL